MTVQFQVGKKKRVLLKYENSNTPSVLLTIQIPLSQRQFIPVQIWFCFCKGVSLFCHKRATSSIQWHRVVFPSCQKTTEKISLKISIPSRKQRNQPKTTTTKIHGKKNSLSLFIFFILIGKLFCLQRKKNTHGAACSELAGWKNEVLKEKQQFKNCLNV